MDNFWNPTWQSKGTKDSETQGMVTPPDKNFMPAEVLAKSEGNLEWVDGWKRWWLSIITYTLAASSNYSLFSLL